MKRKISRYRGRSEDKMVGSEAANLQRPSRAQLCATQWMRGGWRPWGGCLLEGRWCYVCRVLYGTCAGQEITDPGNKVSPARVAIIPEGSTSEQTFHIVGILTSYLIMFATTSRCQPKFTQFTLGCINIYLAGLSHAVISSDECTC